MNRYIAPIVVFVILLGVFMIGLNKDPTILPSPFIGRAAPAFDLPTLENASKRVSNADLSGQVVLVNVWATWCVGCRQEHEFLLQLARDKVIPIYGLNWRDRREDALQWLRQLGNPYVVSGYDGDGKAGIDWGVYGAPETFLIAKDGTVLYKYLGPLNSQVWQQEFEPRILQAEGSAS
ncbi:MAG: DsbE family thiol:disulfide interchange protein [Gammaproteobacteria bacterium]|nr:DsbE family thiol:disulfide interchange protein [Gammaproteobacteria bacterium]MDH4313690.1 DsbE family thiol:disulfide interchange protein [Gammaproteobacteria bacterium]MDH5214593.1 DsbE family thiol:disulfide interchange protein [Gammaproteobacteria bacterium]